MLDAALAAEPEPDRAPRDGGVPIAEGRKAERAVGPGIFVVTDADQAGLQEAHHRGEDLLARQPRPGDVAGDPAADARQGPPEGDQPAVLRLVLGRPPALMIAV